VLLAAILFPAVTGLFMLRGEIVHVLIATAFQPATLTILPLAALTGAIRNFRAHFSDQAFLLHRRPRGLVAINAIEATLTVGLSIMFVMYWGLAGSVIATTAAATVAATLSFTVSIVLFDLRLPIGHLLRVVAASVAMAIALYALPESDFAIGMSVHIALGAAVYVMALALMNWETVRPYMAEWIKAPLARSDRTSSSS
jgi:hypothetical protein